MDTHKTIDHALGLLARYEAVPGFCTREQQQAMATALVADLADGGQTLLEAPTGTGKTLAYLGGALALAEAQDKKVLIATATVSLQRQLMTKDLPEFAEVTGAAFSYALAKGRSRWVCPDQLAKLGQGYTVPALAPVGAQLPGEEVIAVIAQRMSRRLADQHWDGDLDEWPEPLSPGLAGQLVSSRESCTGKRCRHRPVCPFYQMRDQLLAADVVVTNHNLLLADLELGGGRLLPPPDSLLLVLDEAHGVARKVLYHAARELDCDQLVHHLGLARRLGQRLAEALPQIQYPVADLHTGIDDATQWIGELHTTLMRSRFVNRLLADGQSGDRRLRPGEKITLFVRERGEAMLPELSKLLGVFSRYHDALAEACQVAALDDKTAASLTLQLTVVRIALRQAVEYWQLLLAADPEQQPATARWLSAERSPQGEPRLRLHASPSWAGDWLQERLWSQFWGVAVVSATLRALGSFAHFRQLAGLPGDVLEHVFDSVLDHARQAELLIPWLEHTPGSGRDEQAYFHEVAEILPALLPATDAALVLFTSRVAMRRTYDALPSAFRGQVLMQASNLSHGALLDAHEARVLAGQGSVIFGLASFAEGIDLPGDLCRHLVITRLPFPAFSHPIAANARDWFGGNYFASISLPQASMRLIQACGRLLRNESDHGRIIILDRRIQLKSYGRTLLQHLPPYRRQVENSQLRIGEPRQAAAGGGTLIF
jgi:ATP-dependent DNA helicase DinG